jgi:hypothetical protein
MACHKQKPDNHKANDKGNNGAHQVAQVARQGATKAYNRKRAQPSGVPRIIAGIRVFTLHTDNETDTQRRRKLIKDIELNHHSKSNQKIAANEFFCEIMPFAVA